MTETSESFKRSSKAVILQRTLSALLLGALSACAGAEKGAPLELAPPSLCVPNQAPATWAVVIGIDDYQDPGVSALTGASIDAWLLYHYLAAPQGAGIDPSRRRLLLNEQASRANIEQALGQFLGRACPQDQVIIYFAGHGVPEPGRGEEAFLLPQDASLNNLVGTALAMSQLPSFLSWRAGQAGQLLFIVDACHAGRLLLPGSRGVKLDLLAPPGTPAPADEAEARSGAIVDGLQRLSSGRAGWAILSAADRNQLAFEGAQRCQLAGADYPGGLFTCSLLRALSGEGLQGALRSTGRWPIASLAGQLEREVMRRSSGLQRPRLLGDAERSGSLAALSTPLLIPAMPAGYGYRESARVPQWALYTAGAAGLAALTGAGFAYSANGEVEEQEINPSTTRVAFEAGERNWSRAREAAVVSYLSASALALVATGGWLWEETRRALRAPALAALTLRPLPGDTLSAPEVLPQALPSPATSGGGGEASGGGELDSGEGTGSGERAGNGEGSGSEAADSSAGGDSAGSTSEGHAP